MKVKVQSENISATIMYNMKSDNQAKYAQNVYGQKFNCHIRYSPLHQISMGLLLIHFDRNNVIVDILMFGKHLRKSDILNKDPGHRSFRGTTKKCESKNLNKFFF